VSPSIVSPLKPEKAIPILERQISKVEVLLDEPWNSPLREEWLRTCESALIAALGDVNPVIDAFSVAQSSFTWSSMTEYVRRKRENERLDDSLAAIRSGIEQLRWKFG
jgi:hypothetical protein